MDQANVGGIDQLQLTAEEKEESILRTLNSKNPQAAKNISPFSFKDRVFKIDEQVDQLTFHHQHDGNILLRDSEDAMDQEFYKDNKKRMEEVMLERMNKVIN